MTARQGQRSTGHPYTAHRLQVTVSDLGGSFCPGTCQLFGRGLRRGQLRRQRAGRIQEPAEGAGACTAASLCGALQCAASTASWRPGWQQRLP